MDRDKRVAENLRDAGCSSSVIDDFLQCSVDGRTKKQLQILARHRRSLLDEIHVSQKKLDCLDYLYHEIENA